MWLLFILFNLLWVGSPLLEDPALAASTSAGEAEGIFNAHEHFQSMACVPQFLEAMSRSGVGVTVIVGSPEATLLKGRQGFYGEDQNNEEVLKIAEAYPNHFIAFPTINPRDPDKLEKLKRYLKKGARGLKLYSGHSLFHDLALDDAAMTPVYDYCEKHQIPILFHVNAGYFQEEFERVLARFPRLKVICPHFCLSSIRSDRLESLMDTYPSLYSDVSFGSLPFLVAGLRRISQDPEKFRNLLIKYQDRFLFGTDMVVTEAPTKTADWLAQVARAYRDFLEQDRYQFFGIPHMSLRGLHLEAEVLEKIYRKNFERFFYGKEDGAP